jgi:uncharacterized protein YfdQ (DUF2303 family)
MITKDAIQELAQAQAITAAAMALNNGDALAALPEEFKLLDLEQYLPVRRRLRGSMTTPVLDDFAAYTAVNAEEGAAVFVGTASMQAVAVLNLGNPANPGHGDNRAILAPPKTAAFESMLAVASGIQKRQAEVAEWIEDWAPLIRCENEAGEDVQAKHAAAAVRKITIEGTRRQEASEQQLSAARSTFEQVKAADADKLPALIDVTCEPYQGLAARTFRLRLGIVTGDKPALVLRVVKREQHDEEMAQELARLVRDALAGKSVPVLVGSYSMKG